MKPTVINNDRSPSKVEKKGLRLLCSTVLTAMLLGSPGLSAQAAEEDPCTAISQQQLIDLIYETESLVALVEYTEALSQLATIESKLACTEAPISRAQLTQIYVFRGVTWFYLASEEAALKEFDKALTISPDYQWDTALGQRPKIVFDQAREQNFLTKKTKLTCPTLAQGVQVAVDGELLESNASRDLHPGLHLLQYKKDDDGTWVGVQFSMAAQDSLQLVPLPTGLVAAEAEALSAKDTSAPAAAVNDDPVPSSSYEDESGSVFKVGLWTGVGLSAAGFVTVTVAGTQFLASNKLLESYYQDETDPLRIFERDAELKRNSELARATNIGWVVTGVGVATATTFAVLNSRDSSLSFSPTITPNLLAFSVQGRF